MTDSLVAPRLALATLLALVAGGAAAQVAPDAARALDPSLQREGALRDREYFEQRQNPPETPSDEPVIVGPERTDRGALPENELRFTLSEIRFSDSAFIAPETLDAIAAPYVGRPVSFADLNAMVAEVNAIYAERGIVSARALIPPQTIDNGVLRVRLVEGRLGELEIRDAEAIRRWFLEQRLPLQPGAVVDVPALRDALTWINRTTELQLQAALRAGADPGETDVVVSVSEPPRVSAQVFAGNAGAESTGEYRGGAVVDVYAPLGIDDRLTVYGVGSEGATSGLVAYGLPFNRHGGRLDLSYSVGEVEIVNGPFRDLEITGDSNSTGLTLTQPFLRGDRFWLEGFGGASWIESTTDIAGARLSDFEVTRYTLGVGMRGFGERLIWSLNQSVSRAESENLFGDVTRLNLFNGSGQLLLRVTDRFSAEARGAWQFTSEETAPSPLTFQVGGVSSVRGYPEGALAGGRGYYLNLEARYRWRDGLVPFVFADHGLVDDISPDRETITSAGIGLGWQYGRYLSGEIAWGQTFETVLPDQDEGRLHARIALSWSGF
jgi:hemolysin activation/secretion protein